jgi:hypothetical protein
MGADVERERRGAARHSVGREVAMFAHADTTELPAEVIAAGLVLAECDGEWVLASKFDPRLTVGSRFRVGDQVWTVTWESDEGFGERAGN